MHIHWKQEAKKRQPSLIDEAIQFLRIPSVLESETAGPGRPFGQPIADALNHILNVCEAYGFETKNVDGYAGHAEYGTGEEIVGVLCHVDVVPPGDGWSSDPFSPEIRDGKLYARGAIDDKGPTVAAVLALSIVKESGLPLSKRVRLIFGTDEENGDWNGLRYYFEREPMPVVGFAPDADFPIIVAEKGILNAELVQPIGSMSTTRSDGWILVSFHAGNRVNMVPDVAIAMLAGGRHVDGVRERFQSFLMEHHLQGSVNVQQEQVRLKLKGVSHHGMEPEKGLNAALALARFLNILDLDERGHQFIDCLKERFVDSFFGEKLGMAYEDDVTGKLTVNLGTASYAHHQPATLGVNIRYPKTVTADDLLVTLRDRVAPYRFEIGANVVDQPPHYVDKNHPLIKTLTRVYEEQTGEKAELLAIGGGTYGRALTTGVAYGPLFPGEEVMAHQKDEYVDIENLTRAMGIYAQAIYELAR